jgi:uncharacterized membrane protein
MKGKHGQIEMWAYSFMLGITIIILGLALAPVGQSFINNAMSTSTADMVGLDCGNSSISNFDKGTCTILDFSSFYFFGGVILIGGAVILSRLV